jgi:protein O-GlcNAc transferase
MEENCGDMAASARESLDAGRLEEAASTAQAVLEREPENKVALLVMGDAALIARKPNVALPLYSRLIDLDPEMGLAHLGLGRAYRAMDKVKPAISHLETAVRLMPGDVEARFQLAGALVEAGRSEEALFHLDQAERLAPDLPEIPAFAAFILAGMGGVEAAVSRYEAALSVKPTAEIHSAFAGLLASRGRWDEAILHYEAAVALNPENAQAWNNLSGPLKLRGRLKESVAALRKAVALDPGNAIIRNNLALSLRLEEGCSEAIEHVQKAILLKPDFADAHVNLGYILNLLGQHDGAVQAISRALAMEPSNPMIHGALGHVLNAMGDNKGAVEAFRRSLELDPSSALVRSNLLMTLCYAEDVSPEKLFEEHGRWGEIQEAPFLGKPVQHGNEADPEKRIVLGYVSPDFRVHSVSYFFEPVAACHDHGKFEVILYDNQLHGDAVTERLKGMADKWRPIRGLSDDEAAAQVRADGVDILVDLAGHSADNRLGVFARKPAPVQVTWIGYPNTTGLKAMDWRFTDQVADPPGLCDRLHTERLYRLPYGFLCFRPPDEAPEVTPLAARLPGQALFGCFNNHSKISDTTIALWAKILKAMPLSLMVVKNRSMDDAKARDELIRRFACEGIEEGRLKLLGRIPGRGGHLAAYNLIDIALDTFPYSGTATTCESLWMGTPVVTLAGQTHVSRVSASLLTHLGLEDLVAETGEDYVAKALALAQEPERIALLRLTLRDRLKACPMLNAKLFTRSVEEAYGAMWRAWCRSAQAT